MCEHSDVQSSSLVTQLGVIKAQTQISENFSKIYAFSFLASLSPIVKTTLCRLPTESPSGEHLCVLSTMGDHFLNVLLHKNTISPKLWLFSLVMLSDSGFCG